jgi:hypothetical protein
MKTSTLRAVVLLLMAGGWSAGLAGCTIVAPEGHDAGTKVKTIILKVPRPDALPPPKPLQASVLYVADLQRSSANIADQYAQIIIGLTAAWQAGGLSIANMGLISTYADKYGPRLLLGRSSTAATPPSSLALLALLAQAADAGMKNYQDLLPLIAPTLGNIDDGDLSPALKLLAASGQFDGDGETSEAKNVIEFGRGLGTQALPAELGGIDRSAFFDVPHNLFIVVYLQPLPRRCALGTAACNVDGRSPTDIFTETDSSGGAAWLSFTSGSIPIGQVVHLSVATAEGQSQDAFEKSCKSVAGFPVNVLDVIAPSPNAFFTPLLSALNGANSGTGHAGDFCKLIGSSPVAEFTSVANSVAAVAISH